MKPHSGNSKRKQIQYPSWTILGFTLALTKIYGWRQATNSIEIIATLVKTKADQKVDLCREHLFLWKHCSLHHIKSMKEAVYSVK